MATTIQISNELVESLRKRKINPKESYEDIIWDLIEDSNELSEETKRNIAESRKQYERGEVISWKDIKKELDINV